MATIEPLHDAVKALRELLGLFDDVAVRIKVIADFWSRARRRKLASQLATLRFPREGFLSVLEEIASTGLTDDLAFKLKKRLFDTEMEVKESIGAIEYLRQQLVKSDGMKMDRQIEDMLFMKAGEKGIRRYIEEFVSYKHVELEGARGREVAGVLIKHIHDLNSRLEKIHDELIGLREERANPIGPGS